MRFLLECTYVFDHPNDNSGIQRVVRNVIQQMATLQDVVPCIPIVFKRGKVYRVNHLKPLKFNNPAVNLRTRVGQFRSRYWLWHHKLHYKKPFNASRFLRRLLHESFRLGSICYLIPLAIMEISTRLWFGKERVAHLDVRADDVLILLDSSWHYPFFDDVKKLKSQGTTVVGVMYDLIPLTHPQFCDRHLVKVFSDWFRWITGVADGFMCISKTVAGQLQQFDQTGSGQIADRHRWYDHFYLGAELDQEKAGARISPQVRAVFQSGRPVYLTVSTIEPRKNHDYLLDVFDRLWEAGSDLSLCIVGKVGWKCDALIQRIETHPELNRRLFMLNSLSDSELAYCYKASKALVFSSFVEGFGLPLIEALGRGLPVMASDIPVFREVVGDFAIYFDLTDPADLVRAIEAFESESASIRNKKLATWQWLTWRDSTVQLIQRVKRNIERTSSQPER